MELWQAVHFVPVDQLTGIARDAEAVGFTGIALGDHLALPGGRLTRYPYSPDGSLDLPSSSPFPDPWVAIAAMSGATSTLLFAPHVFILPLREPISVAKSIATAAILSGNRLRVGIGVGWLREEFDAVGVDFRTRGRRTDEMITVIQSLWNGGLVSHSGEFFQLDDIEISPIPTASVPLLAGGHSEASLLRATRHNGWIGLRLDSRERGRLINRLREIRGDERDGGPPFHVEVSLEGSLGPKEYNAYQAQGVTGLVAPPYPVGTSPAARRAGMEAMTSAFLAAREAETL